MISETSPWARSTKLTVALALLPAFCIQAVVPLSGVDGHCLVHSRPSAIRLASLMLDAVCTYLAVPSGSMTATWYLA